jgi:hypothetical protein
MLLVLHEPGVSVRLRKKYFIFASSNDIFYEIERALKSLMMGVGAKNYVHRYRAHRRTHLSNPMICRAILPSHPIPCPGHSTAHSQQQKSSTKKASAPASAITSGRLKIASHLHPPIPSSHKRTVETNNKKNIPFFRCPPCLISGPRP